MGSSCLEYYSFNLESKQFCLQHRTAVCYFSTCYTELYKKQQQEEETLLGKHKKPSAADKVLLRHLKSFLHDGIYSDVQFVITGEKISGHTLIIKEGSPVLAAMFQNDMTEASSRTVIINDVEPIVFRQLLCYLYTGEALEVKDDGMETEPFFIAADKYGVDSLKDWCGAVMSKKLKVDNAMRFLVLAHLHSAKKLEENCICFIVRNKSVFWQQPEFKQLGENYFKLFFDITRRMNV